VATYDSIAGLEAVYLEDSFVLAVTVQPNKVYFVVDVVLTEEHSQYSEPRDGEQYCYRRGRLEFLEPRQVNWRMSSRRATYDAEGETDYGGFDHFEVGSSRYVVAGDFGTLEIEAMGCELILAECCPVPGD